MMNTSITPTSRSTLNERRQYVPTPMGCVACYTRTEAYYDGCDHTTHFTAIKGKMVSLGFQWVDAGSFRTTFRKKGRPYVYKIPHGGDGYCDNYFEALAWMQRDHLYATVHNGVVKEGKIGHRIARCSMLPNGILVMEHLKDANSWGHGRMDEACKIDPTLVDDPAQHLIHEMDGCQGGFDSKGRFKLYDFTHRAYIVDDFSSMEAL